MSRISKVLVVDGESGSRKALAALLRDGGFEVETAAQGLEALAKVTTFRPHVVIADLDVQETSGLELVASMAYHPVAPAVIAMTAVGDAAAAIAALRAGASDYITKPVYVDELLVVLDKVLHHHQLEQEVVALREQRT